MPETYYLDRRIFVEADEIALKIDFVNDVPSRFGNIEQSSVFHRIDSWRNILSNKICALSRRAQGAVIGSFQPKAAKRLCQSVCVRG